MGKQFDVGIVADVFGGSFDEVSFDLPQEPRGTRRQQLSVILSKQDHDRMWDEVDRRRREARANGASVNYGPSHLIEEYVDAFLSLPPQERDARYELVTKGDKRFGIRLSADLRDAMEEENARRVTDGTERSRATITSIVVAAIRLAAETDGPSVVRKMQPTHADDLQGFLM
jgi:hypothetical protein